MLNNKKGISAIVMTIIMVGLVLVAVGIVWTVVLNIIEGQSESLDYNQDCLGINFEISDLSCNFENCTFVIERKTGSGNPIDGMGVTFSSGSESGQELSLKGNIAATITKSDVSHELANSIPTRVDARIYFEIDDDSNHYCSQIISSE